MLILSIICFFALGGFMKKLWLFGFLAGILNGVFGSGGGVIVVPMLKKIGVEIKKSHATSVAIILFMSIVSVIIYAVKGVGVDYSTLVILVIAGIFGALIGVKLFEKINSDVLRRIFGLIIIISAIRRIFF